jgi:asparagine synthase (glutamine-hydrolysing)
MIDTEFCDTLYFDGFNERSFLNYELRFEIETRLWADLLMKLDSASMPFSLEGRVPYLDHRLVEYSACIPPSLKVKYTKEKWILREAAKSYLPDKIRKRKKEHFFVPIDTWLQDDLANFVNIKLEPEFIKRQGIFNPEYISYIKKSYKNGALVYARQLWNLICFQIWYSIYLENETGWLSERASANIAPKVTYAFSAKIS